MMKKKTKKFNDFGVNNGLSLVCLPVEDPGYDRFQLSGPNAQVQSVVLASAGWALAHDWLDTSMKSKIVHLDIWDC